MDIAKLRFVITPERELVLPPYKGAVLRGGFGRALQQLCHPGRGEECRWREKCLYCYIFETKIWERGTSREIVRPYAIEPPLEGVDPSVDGKIHYTQGEELAFHLLLFGRALDYWPTIFLAFKKLGAMGIGQGRGKFRIRRVESIRGNQVKEVYLEETGALAATLLTLSPDSFFHAPEPLITRLVINLVTPMQLTYQHRPVSTKAGLTFQVFMRQFLSRLSALASHHGRANFAWDYRGLIRRAAAVRLDDAASHVAYRTVEVHSERQDPRHKQEVSYQITGFVGTLTYEGEGLEAFVPYLRIGEYTHIGDKTTQGAGIYRILESSS